MTNKALDLIAVSECEFSIRTANIIHKVYGPNATLGDVVKGGGVDRLLEERGFGRRCANEVNDMLRYIKSDAARREERLNAMTLANGLLDGTLSIVSTKEYSKFLLWKELHND